MIPLSHAVREKVRLLSLAVREKVRGKVILLSLAVREFRFGDLCFDVCKMMFNMQVILR